MKRIVGIIVFTSLLSIAETTQAGAGSAILKGLRKYVATEGVETSAEKLAKGITDEAADRIASRLLREGGEQAVERATQLTAKHGPDIVRALDNTTNPSAILKALDDLPVASDVGTAATKLAAGEAGKELAEQTTKFGTKILTAEIKHPGLATQYAKTLGDDGVNLCLKLEPKQALDIGRHLDDIADLPPELRTKLLALADQNPSGFGSYVGNFVKNNPGKVLFTAAATTLLIANPDSLIGTGPADADSNVPTGFIVWVFGQTVGRIITALLYVLVPSVAIYAALMIYKTWRINQYAIRSAAHLAESGSAQSKDEVG